MHKETKYQLFLLAVFLAVWIWAAIDPVYPHDWLLENYLTFIGVPLLLITARYFRLSNLSYTLITIFMILHTIGSHYTYAEVPFGINLQQWLNADRNMYDRLVHFCFGLLLAYPMREIFLRIGKQRGIWGYWIPVELTLAASAIYELIEWGAAAILNPGAGLAFLGSQGDIWDAQKDMALAGLGSLITMTLVLLIHIKYDSRTWHELKASFTIPKGDKPLGEVKLKQLMTKIK